MGNTGTEQAQAVFMGSSGAHIAALPKEFYYIVGFLIFTNLGSILTVAMVALKAVWWTAKADSRIDKAQDTGNRAHKRLDKLEDRFGN